MENQPANKKKAKHSFSREEAVAYLRSLADQLENGTIQVSKEEMEFEGVIKVKESLKSKKGKTSVKVQFKVSTQEMPYIQAMGDAPELQIDEAAPAERADDGQPSSYKKLKKAMNKGFKAMGAALAEGAEVSQSDIEAFCEQSLLMLTYKAADKGEAAYPSFEAAVQALRAAGQSGDMEAVKQAHAGLETIKQVCHKEFK